MILNATDADCFVAKLCSNFLLKGKHTGVSTNLTECVGNRSSHKIAVAIFKLSFDVDPSASPLSCCSSLCNLNPAPSAVKEYSFLGAGFKLQGDEQNNEREDDRSVSKDNLKVATAIL